MSKIGESGAVGVVGTALGKWKLKALKKGLMWDLLRGREEMRDSRCEMLGFASPSPFVATAGYTVASGIRDAGCRVWDVCGLCRGRRD